jgi:hypothetical protein
MKNLLIFFIILLFLNCLSFSQQMSITVNNSVQTEYTDVLPVAKYVGVFYIDMRKQFLVEWNRGDIILTNGKVLKQQLIRYNNYLDELAWLREMDFKTGLLIKEAIKEFIVYPKDGSREQVFRKINTDILFSDDNKAVFYQILAEGSKSFVSLRKLQKSGAMDDYNTSFQYYMLQDSVLTKFNLRRSSLFNLFENEERAKMKAIVRSNHLKVRKEYEMIRAFELFNK